MFDQRVAVLDRNLASLRRGIAAAGGDCDRVRIVAVTKGLGADAWTAAAHVGLADVGENYGQELMAKIAGDAEGAAPPAPLTVHFLGAVQRRKVRMMAPFVDCWQGVSREIEGEEIARHRPGAAVLVEVNPDGSPGRGGCDPHEATGVARALVGMGLRVEGLMTVAPPDPDGARRAFRLVREMADRLGLPERSMGMSQDYRIAVAEGATMIRIGEALFGRRPRPPQP
ncbi:MAG: YggS family pyridoxal phosphate enzyme [Acidimicrobiales bacterium]